MKKFAAVLTAAVMVVSMALMNIVPAHADGNASLTVTGLTDGKVQAGDTLTATVTVPAVSGFDALSLFLCFNTEVLEATDIQYSGPGLTEGLIVETSDVSAANSGGACIVSGMAMSPISMTSPLVLTSSFLVKNGAESGSYSNIIYVDPDDYFFENVSTGEQVQPAMSPSSVDIEIANVITSADVSGLTPVTDAAPVTTQDAGGSFTAAISWSPSVSGTFAPGTEYTASISLTPKAGFYFSESTAVSVEGNSVAASLSDGKLTFSYTYPATEKIKLEGTPSVSGAAEYGETLTADVSGLNEKSNISYQWYRGDAAVDGAVNSTYTLTADDIGSTVKVVVTANPDSAYTGSVSSAPAGPVQKKSTDAPAAISEADISKTETSITVTNPVSGQEYACVPESEALDDSDFGDTMAFTGLNVKSNYNLYTRVKETDTHKASPASTALAVVTDDHTPSTSWTDAGDGTHYKLCVAGCGTIIESSREEHHFTKQVKDNLKDEKTCHSYATYYYVCEECGAVSDSAFWEDTEGGYADHDYNGQPWLSDETGHFHQCKNCTATSTPEAHDTNVKEASDESHHDVKCSVCGYVVSANVDCAGTGDYKDDGEGNHYKECVCGNHTDAAEHSSTGDNVATCQKQAVCDSCGAEYGETLPHDSSTHIKDDQYLVSAATCTDYAVYKAACSMCGLASETETWVDTEGGYADHDYTGQPWLSDETGHFHQCKNCTATSTPEAHDTNVTEASDDSHHDVKCSVCSYVVNANVECTGTGDYKDDGEGNHYKECVCGNHTDVAEHSSTGDNVATCQKKAVCDSCGAEYGEMLPHDSSAHIKDDQYLVSAATCTDYAVYKAACSMCGLASETETWEDTDSGFADHVFEENWTFDGVNHWHKCSNSKCTEITDLEEHVPAEAYETDENGHWHNCSVEGCGALIDATLEDHVYDQENPSEDYLVSEANCISKAVYVKSCKCGKAGTETFEDGEIDPDNHVGDTEIRDAVDKSCTEDGYTGDTYCLSCEQMIEEGKPIPAGHTESEKWSSDDEKHWKTCTECEEIIPESVEKHKDSNGDGTCDTCKTVLKTQPKDDPAKKGPTTGDDTNSAVWVIAIAAACTVIAVATGKRKKA